MLSIISLFVRENSAVHLTVHDVTTEITPLLPRRLVRQYNITRSPLQAPCQKQSLLLFPRHGTTGGRAHIIETLLTPSTSAFDATPSCFSHLSNLQTYIYSWLWPWKPTSGFRYAYVILWHLEDLSPGS